jgi:hypothetical protein
LEKIEIERQIEEKVEEIEVEVEEFKNEIIQHAPVYEKVVQEDEEEEQEEEDEEEEDEEDTPLYDDNEDERYDDMLKEIQQIEKKSMTKEEQEECDFISSKRRDTDTKYHLILQNDGDIGRRKQVLLIISQFKAYHLRTKSNLHDKIDNLFMEKAFDLFMSIKKRYQMIPPTLEYLEKFGKLIHSHPRIREIT